jgi:hypothetical protein
VNPFVFHYSGLQNRDGDKVMSFATGDEFPYDAQQPKQSYQTTTSTKLQIDQQINTTTFQNFDLIVASVAIYLRPY